MDIFVQYHPPLTTVIGKREEMLEVLPGTTIKDLALILVENYGERVERHLFWDGNRDEYRVKFTVNRKLALPERVLISGDRVSILMAFSGG